MTSDLDLFWYALAAFLGSGMVGISKVLLSGSPLMYRTVIGQFIAHTGWGAGAFTILLYDASLPPIGITALAILMASLGASGLEMVLKIWRGAK